MTLNLPWTQISDNTFRLPQIIYEFITAFIGSYKYTSTYFPAFYLSVIKLDDKNFMTNIMNGQ